MPKIIPQLGAAAGVLKGEYAVDACGQAAGGKAFQLFEEKLREYLKQKG